MKRIYILLLVLAVSLSCLADKYLIYSGDALLGTEEVTVFDNKIITKTTLNASGVQLSYTQTLTLSSGKPSQYQANINGVVNITGSFADGEATYTVANQKRTFKGNGLYPVENNTFYLWSYVLKNAPQDLVVPSQFASVKAVYSSWQTGPYQTQVRQVNIQQLALIGYFSDGKMIRFTIPLQNIDVIHEDWVEIFRESSGQTVISETVVLKRGSDLLHGELNLPANKTNYPVLLLISGSGPQDRDSNSPPEMTNSLFKHLSITLTNLGIGTLRFDDRGTGKSTGNHMAQDYETLIQDAREALDYLRNRSDVSKIGILGHSEGGLTALILGAEEEDIAFLVLMAAPSTSLDKIIIEQVHAQKELPGITTEDVAYLDQILAIVESSIELAKSGAEATPLGFTGKYLRDHLEINPLEYAEKITCPVLILQGDADVKVLPYHAKKLENALANAQVITYPYLHHYFTPSSLNNPEFTLESAYKTPDKVYNDIAAFLLEHAF